MKLAAAILLLAVAAPTPEIRYFRYERPILNASQHSAQACVALDPAIFAHAAPQLADLRLYHNGNETPFAIRLAAPEQAGEESIVPLDLGSKNGATVFDAAMPQGAYSDLELRLTAKNFIATVTVSGSQTQTGSAPTKLGLYTVFDLTRQRLGRSTVLHLPRSDFRYLHFRIAGPVSPQDVAGLSAERLPAGEPQYETVAASPNIMRNGRSSVVELTVPAHVPVDRIAFTPGSEPADFSRDVSVAVTPLPKSGATDAAASSPAISFFGNLLRLHRMQNGHRIDEERLAIPAHAADFSVPARWTITIDNGDDAPLTPELVRLQMVERRLCFEAAGNTGYTLFYGDPALLPPRYDYATLFTPEDNAVQTSPGAEEENPTYQPRPDERPFTEKHPALLWAALVAVIALLGAIAFKTAKRAKPAPQ